MKTLLLSLFALPVALLQARLHGQGQFVFEPLNVAADNQVSFSWGGAPASGPDLFVQVFAGPDRSHFVALTPLLPLNQTGALAGLPNPPRQVFKVPGMRGGEEAVVGYVGFKGATLSSAIRWSLFQEALDPVILTEPPTDPNEVHLGRFLIVDTDYIPEPPALSMEFIGLCSLLWLVRKRVPG
jgi:hypothetical protein